MELVRQQKTRKRGLEILTQELKKANGDHAAAAEELAHKLADQEASHSAAIIRMGKELEDARRIDGELREAELARAREEGAKAARLHAGRVLQN